MKVFDIIAMNKSRQRRAGELNARAGQKLFPVLTRAEMEDWVSEKIAGARSVREISNIENLCLPELDQVLAEMVSRENPTFIRMLGQAVEVEYREGLLPKVTIMSDTANSWRMLPDEGVQLPSGRDVEVIVKIGYYDSASGVDIPKLKVQVRNYLNRIQWDFWSKPGIPMPDLATTNPTIPELVNAQYGKCVMDDSPLLAYGAVTVNPSRYYGSDSWFISTWHTNVDVANVNRTYAVAKLEEIRRAARYEQELLNLQQESRHLQVRVLDLYERYRSRTDCGVGLMAMLNSKRYDYIPVTYSELRAWISSTKKLIAEVEELASTKTTPSQETSSSSLDALAQKWGARRK